MAIVAREQLAALEALESAGRTLDAPGIREILRAAGERRRFRPDEEESLRFWFARFLTIRSALWEVMEEASGLLDDDLERVTGRSQLEVFLIAYAAACLVVRLDRLLAEDLAVTSVVQRKLNEAVPEHRIPRKCFTAIYRSLCQPHNAYRMERAMRWIDGRREVLATLPEGPFAELAKRLPELESSLDPSRRRYLGLLARYRLHSLRRRGASARQQVTHSFLETSGRAVSEVRDHWSEPRVEPVVRERLRRLLRPGDVLVTRHERALTNLFLPGYWPHAALFVGHPEDRDRLGVEIGSERATRWTAERPVLEALKDGVRFRPLEETLAVDAVAVLRPRLAPPEVARGLERAARHEGKLYNFDFDFFHSDRLVCTEVVYRAYDGLGELEIPLPERAGRPTLAAEDLLDLALADRGFEVVALFGATSCDPGRVHTGGDARSRLAASYRGSVLG